MRKNMNDSREKQWSDGSTNAMLRAEYTARINRVIDYIEGHLDDELSLDSLAAVANFSRFHFHRVFGAMVGERLNRFIQRVRVERAASQLLMNPKKSITDIAFDCGFSGSAAFARLFKEFIKMTPSKWRKNGQSMLDSNICKTRSNDGETHRNHRKDFYVSPCYINTLTKNLTWRINMSEKLQVDVEVKEMPELNVAYVRHIGPYKGDSMLFENLFKKLMAWAGPRGLLKFPETQCLSVYHDSPEITDEDKLRTSVCITVPGDTEVAGEVGKMTVPGGSFAVARFEIDPDRYGEAWNAIFNAWLPESGFQPDDRLCYELYQNDPNQHPEHKHIFDICVPVRPL